MSITFLLIIICLLLTYIYFTKKYSFWKERNVKGPNPIRIFRNNLAEFLKYIHSSELTKKYYDEYEHEKVIGTFKDNQPVLIIRDPNLINDVLIKDFSVFSDRRSDIHQVNPLDQHIFNLPKSAWRPLKTTLSPCFTNAKISAKIIPISHIIDNFSIYLENELKKSDTLDICPLIFKLTSEVIGYYGFSLKMNEFSNGDTDFTVINKRRWNPSFSNYIKRYSRGSLRSISCLFTDKNKQKEEFYIKLVKDVEAYRTTKNIRINDYYGKLIELSFDPRNEDFIDEYYYRAAQAYVFFTAGSEGIAISISNALSEIANNQIIQNKLRNEILNLIAEKKNDKLNLNDLNKMQYLDKVYKETLRKYPLRDIIRVNNKPYKFTNTNIVIPKNTEIIIPHYAVHRDKRIYPDPEIFDPERFENLINEKLYFPFGEGPRKCMGYKFAHYIFKISIIKILQDFKILKGTTRRNKNNAWKVFLYPEGGIKLQLQKL